MFTFQPYGVCHVAVAPVRAAASDTAEIVTQLLFGDHVKVLETGRPWIKIQFSPDQYEGWMDFKQLTYIDQTEYDLYYNQTPAYLCDGTALANGPDGPQHLMFGSALLNLSGNEVTFGNRVYRFDKAPNTIPLSLLETAMNYLNTPYLWGGKSIFGIDCSGFTQNCFKVHGYTLPRDASQQVHLGIPVPFSERQPGDVPFFINPKGNVHHVGILTDNDTIIHASGSVRLDPFDEKGIYRADLDEYTHQLHSIKRFV